MEVTHVAVLPMTASSNTPCEQQKHMVVAMTGGLLPRRHCDGRLSNLPGCGCASWGGRVQHGRQGHGYHHVRMRRVCQCQYPVVWDVGRHERSTQPHLLRLMRRAWSCVFVVYVITTLRRVQNPSCVTIDSSTSAGNEIRCPHRTHGGGLVVIL